jgi:predicted metal-dependent hydrolase
MRQQIASSDLEKPDSRFKYGNVAMTALPPQEHPLRSRNVRFAFARDAGGYWLDGDPFRTRFFDAFSTMLPIGEKFFIDALRRVESQIDDPALADQVRTFIVQEATHGREHRRYNERLRALGYDLDAMDRSQSRVMGRILKAKRPTVPLAVTVAIEHITAVFGASVLRGELLEGCDSDVADFWKWHSAEEIEHKAVAFDVFTRVGGGPELRRAIMAWAVFIISVRMASRVAHMLRRDGVLLEPRVWRSGVGFLLGPGGFLRSIGPDFVRFFRRDFHPWQDDDYALVERWERASPVAAAPLAS